MADADLYHAVLRGMTDRVRVHDGIGEVLAELAAAAYPGGVHGQQPPGGAILSRGTGLRAT